MNHRLWIEIKSFSVCLLERLQKIVVKPDMRVLDKKIQKVLGMKTTQSDIQEALDSFAEYYDTAENTVDSRKNLRYSLEGISCDLTKKFASELSKFYSVWIFSPFFDKVGVSEVFHIA